MEAGQCRLSLCLGEIIGSFIFSTCFPQVIKGRLKTGFPVFQTTFCLF